MASTKISNSKFIKVLYLFTFFVSFAYGFIYVLPLYTLNLGGNAVNVSFFLTCAGCSSILLVGKSGFIANKIGSINLCAISTLVTGIATLILYWIKDINVLYYFSGLLLGIGWSYFYVAAPIVLNHWVSDRKRGKHIGLLSAFIVCGTGLAPILANFILENGFSIHKIYIIPTILLLVLTLAFFIFSLKFKTTFVADTIIHGSQIKHPMKSVFKSNAIFAIVMVFLGACVFSTMMNFQTLFALNKHLNYSIYYASYMISVVACRFVFSRIFTKKNVMLPTPYLLICMMVGLIILLLIPAGMNWLYSVSAMLLGVSYGLTYPLIKTYAINSVKDIYRSYVIAYFTLAYFIGVYFFPLIAGPIIDYLGFSAILITLLFLLITDAIIGYRQAKKYIKGA